MQLSIKQRMILGLALLIITWILFRGVYLDVPVQTMEANYTNEQSRFISVNGMRVHYRDEGQGPVIVLLHGVASSLHTWEGWAATLKNDYRVIRMDLPGFGLTGPHPQGLYSPDDYVDFLQTFFNQLQLQKFVLVGNSLGGHVAFRYAADYPKQVEYLGLLNPAGLPRKSGPPLIFKLAKRPILGIIFKYVTPKYMVKKNLEQVYFSDSLVTQEMVDHYHGLLLRAGNRQAFIDRLRTEKKENTKQILRGIQTPTLIIWGEGDAWIPVEQAASFDSLLSESTVIIMDSAGHVPMEERPKQSVQLLRAWLKAKRPAW